MLQHSDIENRGYGVVPLSGGLNFTDSKALVTPGTLQDTLNYEVRSRGYTRAQGLLLYHGTYDYAIENMWYVADTDANSTLTGVGTFTLGGVVTWEGGSGICIYWDEDAVNNTKALGIVDSDGLLASTAVEFTDASTGTVFTVTRTPTTLATATYAHNSSPVAATITDYLTFIGEVNTAVAAQTADTWPNYKPKIPGTGGITGGFQFKDTVYAARDYVGIGFYDGVNEPVHGDILTVGSFTGKTSLVVLEAGAWEEGDAQGVIYIEPSITGTNDASVYEAIPEATQVVNSTAVNNTARVSRDRNKNKSHLWKATVAGWSMVDLGFGIRFRDGENAPSAQVAPLFLPAIAGVTSSVQDTGFVSMSDSSAVGDLGTYSIINNITNIYADDGAVADTTINASGLSQLIECNPTDYVDATNTSIIGVEVEFEASQTAGTDAYIHSVRLVNDSSTTEQYRSDNLTDKETLTGSPTKYAFGGQVDLWGMKAIQVEDLNSGDVRVQIQFGNNNISSTRTVEVDYVKIKIHYISRGQTLYFHDGSTDVATADVYSFEVHDGDWVDNDATGYMAFHNVSNPAAIVAGLTMYTAANTGGVVVATTAGDLQRNLLPSEAELAEENSQWRTVEANFYQNDEGKGMYVATGADSAFMYDLDDHMAFIRLPVARDKDKPRHVAFHANHLVLGMDSGHALVSAVDVPNDFDTSGTATTWPFRDPITGLNSLAGNALGVMCRESVHALLGTQAPADAATDPFRTQNITPRAGALEYTVADVMGPMYADFSGVGRVDTSDKFGDFEQGRLTQAIEDWTRERFQKQPSSELTNRAPVLAIPVRAKNQYRVYFEDGYILSLYLGTSERPPEPMLGHLDPDNLSTDYVPTWADSTVLSNGRERVVMGDKNGNVWIVDGANGIQKAEGLTEVPCYITTNPINTGFPQGASKTYSWTLIGDFMGAQNITTSTGYDYLDVEETPRTKSVGSYSDAPIFDDQTGYTEVYTGSYTDGVSLKVETTMDGSKPHTLHTLLHRFSRKGSGRNNTTINRG